MFHPSASLSRRDALRTTARLGVATAAGVSALTALTGCTETLDRLRAPATTSPARAVSADRAVVDDVVTALRAAFDSAPQPFRRLHRAHLTALGVAAGTPAGDRQDAGVVRRRERSLPDVLVQAAVRAQSGDLIRLLASMAAAQRQLLAQHPEVVR